MARPHCDIFAKGDMLPTGVMMRRWVLQTRYMLRCNAASIMKDLVWFDKKIGNKLCKYITSTF